MRWRYCRERREKPWAHGEQGRTRCGLPRPARALKPSRIVAVGKTRDGQLATWVDSALSANGSGSIESTNLAAPYLAKTCDCVIDTDEHSQTGALGTRGRIGELSAALFGRRSLALEGPEIIPAGVRVSAVKTKGTECRDGDWAQAEAHCKLTRVHCAEKVRLASERYPRAQPGFAGDRSVERVVRIGMPT